MLDAKHRSDRPWERWIPLNSSMPKQFAVWSHGYVHAYLFNPFSAGTVFKRQILTSKDDPRTERAKYL